MRLTDIKEYLNTLLASFSSVLNLELTILQTDPLERVAAAVHGTLRMWSVMNMEDWFRRGRTAIRFASSNRETCCGT
ncbi:MAG: hypothetical protein ACLTFJ_11855 [Clostridium sp.]